MPAPAPIYVLAALGTVAAGIAFKEFVYDPYIAPQFERWMREIEARNQERRMRRQRSMPVASSTHGDSDDDDNWDDDGGHQDRFFGRGLSVELEDMKQVSRDIYQWRSGTRDASGSGIRLRSAAGPSNTAEGQNRSPLVDFNDFITPTPLTPNRLPPIVEQPASSVHRWSSVTGSSITLETESASYPTLRAQAQALPNRTLRQASVVNSPQPSVASRRSSLLSLDHDLPAIPTTEEYTYIYPGSQTLQQATRSPSLSTSTSRLSFNTAVSAHTDMPSIIHVQPGVQSPFSDTHSYFAPTREDAMSPFSIAASDVDTLSSGGSAFADDNDMFSAISAEDAVSSRMSDHTLASGTGSHHRDVFSDFGSEASWEDVDAPFTDVRSVASSRR